MYMRCLAGTLSPICMQKGKLALSSAKACTSSSLKALTLHPLKGMVPNSRDPPRSRLYLSKQVPPSPLRALPSAAWEAEAEEDEVGENSSENHRRRHRR